MRIKTLLLILTASVLVPTVVVPATCKSDIVGTAVSSPNHKTLVKLIKAAGLVEALKAEGPFTVFAPTDAAFAKLPKATVESLTKPENKEQLKAVLLYHVVKGKVTAKDVMSMKSPTSVETLNGAKIKITHSKKGVMVNNAKVTTPDLMATNGVIHVIDAVLLPPKR
jgi:uncharacterized surface protein with fasciclin (FAS1) repeats